MENGCYCTRNVVFGRGHSVLLGYCSEMYWIGQFTCVAFTERKYLYTEV